jgi:superfamily II DNA or RNA helicase
MAELALGDFHAALSEGDRAGQRRAFYLLAGYYARTIRILRSGLDRRNEPLVQATLHNLIALHQPLTQMHRAAPDDVPFPMTVDRQVRDRFVKDLIVRVLSETPEPMNVTTLVQRVNDLDLLGTLGESAIRRHLRDLIDAGHVAGGRGQYERTSRIYSDLVLDELGLQALVGDDLYERLGGEGFQGLNDVGARKAEFRAQFPSVFGLGDATADAFVEVVETLLETRERLDLAAPWHHVDLIGSPYPRPYQYESYAVFRGNGYQGQLVEAPTGSGKTMIGMMCIQDWLRSMTAGQAILVLVPTSNYLQQWVGELCYKPIGLRLSPEGVFAGTPTQLQRYQRRTGTQPAVILMTYTALAQIGSGVGKGGFDIDSVEMFLQGASIQHVILDEVHKTVENMRSVSADVTRLLVEWLQDGSIRGLIGFSGTATAYRRRFATLGLRLAYTIDVVELVGYGFVAPFAVYGVPFSDSTRERQIRNLLASYKGQMREYFKLLGGEQLRALFAEVPLAERVEAGRDLLGIYRGRADVDSALAQRMAGWQSGGALKLNEAPLVTILQITRGWSDEDLCRQVGADRERFEAIRKVTDGIRQELAGLIYLPHSLSRLQKSGFGVSLDVDALRRLPIEVTSIAARVGQAKDLLSTTIVGLYRGLSDWYLRVGEGRVEMIQAIVEAERQTRPVSGVIVFDRARRIRWRGDVATPGYDGVGGLFAHMLGDPRFTIMAALSSELYLTYDEDARLPQQISQFIEDELLRGEIADAILSLVTQGLELPAKALDELQARFSKRLEAYFPRLAGVRRPRPGEFSRRVLGSLRRLARSKRFGPHGDRLRARLTLRNVHLANLIRTFFDYAILAEDFRRARVAELEQVSGVRQKFFVVAMPAGRRKTLMYDLTSRIVDAETLPVNLIIVSSWARTGWNVIQPNLLIDATATRNVTAWQQLRGRAMRALPTWTNDCYRLIRILEEGQPVDLADRDDLPEDIARGFQEAVTAAEAGEVLDERLRALLSSVSPPHLAEQIAEQGVAALSEGDRESLAQSLMLARNKVTHVYELVKAYGSTSQVQYHRPTRSWHRREAIAAKHQAEMAVNPLTGELLRGVGNAPLLYASDPRTDLPADLERHLSAAIAGRDPMIVSGWLKQDGPESS